MNRGQHRRRRSVRLPGYDYAGAGAYFVTICTQDRACLFGAIVGEAMHLNEAGKAVQAAWRTLPERFLDVDLDAFVIMPNHIHGVVLIAHRAPDVGAGSPRPASHQPGRASVADPPASDAETTSGAETAPLPQTGKHLTLGQIVAYFKYQSAKQINAMRQTPGAPVWQRNYYEHVVRDEASLTRIRQYVLDNPARWAFDRENPSAIRPESP